MRMLKFLATPGLAVLVMCLCVLPLSGPVEASQTRWHITKDHWDASDEQGWENFITALGREDCWSIDECLKSPANPYRDSDPRVKWLADCADVPYLLRAYYAWKNGLPFAWQAGMRSGDRGGDLRYSSSGNIITGRTFVPATASGVAAIPKLFEIVNTISTAMYRRSALSDSARLFADTYSPALNRQGIRPGTIAYDVNGHVSIVWRVEPGGRILIFSSHPDHTLSRSFVGREFLRTGPELGSIFQNWRPIRLVGARQTSSGAYVGGQIVGTPNTEIADFSLEQYTGNPPTAAVLWSTAKFIKDGEQMDFYTYLRASVAQGGLSYSPVDELRAMMQTLCSDIRVRRQAIDISIHEGRTNTMSPPARLPRNIYGTDGVWELYSTPSRDARLKTAFKEMYDQTQEFLRMKAENEPRLNYKGTDLAGDLLRAYDEENAACRTPYERSDGSSITLTIDDIVHRLFKLSFDPYQCVERRWGASGAELATCRDGAVKNRWYDAQQKLRNQIDRTYAVKMDSSVEELERGPWGIQTGRGVEQAPEVDVRHMLATYAPKVNLID